MFMGYGDFRSPETGKGVDGGAWEGINIFNVHLENKPQQTNSNLYQRYHVQTD